MIKWLAVKPYILWLPVLATLAMAQQGSEKKDTPPPSENKQESAPLFQKKIFQSFECHRLLDGSLHVVGLVTSQEAALIDAGRESLEINLYPEPNGEAVKAVSLSLDRLNHVKAPSRDEGNFMRVRVNPIQ